MVKLRKYLKPFTFGILMAIVLLFAEAIFNLNLPNYMSEIVNVGIQQNGIEKGIPGAISQKGYTFITTFMTDNEKALMNENYLLKSAADVNSSGKQYDSLYPNTSGQQIYVLKSNLSANTTNRLENVFGTATWTMINVMKSLAQEQGSNLTLGSKSTNLQSMDITRAYQMQPILAHLPDTVFDTARQKALSMDNSILKQSGTMMVGAFYKELGVDLGDYQRNYIIHIGLIMLLFTLGSGIATVLVSLLSSRIAAGVARDLRNDIFSKVSKFSNAEYDQFSTASLITRSTNDVLQIQMVLLMGIRMLIFAPIMAAGGIIMALNKSVSMSWIIALACIVLIGFIGILFTIVIPKFKAMQKFIDRVNLVAREALSGLTVIRAFGTSQFEIDRFDRANKDLTQTNLFVFRAMTFMMPIMMLIMNASTILIIWVGAHYVAQSQIQVGDMMAFMQYAIQIIFSFFMISMMFVFIPRAAVSAQRIAEVLEVNPTILDPRQPVIPELDKKGYVEFKNVSFRYEGAEEDALKGISFIAKPGETTAFIGSTGAGKTTLINLIMRFYDVTEGQVLVNGTNVKDVTQKELRKYIGYVPQKSVLLSGTIESNIRYGDENASDDEVIQSAKVAQAYDFISEKDEGFKSEISQGGSNISGGQKQRLSIARALAVKPDIYLFDDSFSALDFKTDAALRKALKEHTSNSTVIIVAQRVSTIMNADQIYVIDHGEIIGHGTHKELLKNCPEYNEIASSQLSKEELDHE